MKTGLGKYLHSCMFLAPIENMVKLKMFYTLTVKYPFSPRKTISLVVLPSNHILQTEKVGRERERERWVWNQTELVLDTLISFSLLLNVADLATTDHQLTPLHPKPTRSGYRRPPSTSISLFPNLSLFPSIYHSFSLRSHSFFLLLNVFILIFGCVKVYILKFSVIKFVWKLRKWLRKCEKFVGK